MSNHSRLLRFMTIRLTLGLAFAALGPICLAQSATLESLTHFPRTTLEITAHGHRDRFQIWIMRVGPGGSRLHL